jgi:hypothetical protein
MNATIILILMMQMVNPQNPGKTPDGKVYMDSAPAPKPTGYVDAARITQTFVRHGLKAPRSAVFPAQNMNKKCCSLKDGTLPVNP